jgi:IS1 family transposase
MDQLSTAERVQIIAALVEGNSINSTCRMTGRSKHTVLNLLTEIGAACQKFHDEKVRGLAVRRVQTDEIWSFCHAKAKNVPAEKRGQFGYGDVWTWVAMDADTKLVISYLVGLRDSGYATELMHDLADRVTTRMQLTTDGLHAYLDAVEDAFVGEIDYAMLVKVYGAVQPDAARYSPPVVTGVKLSTISGDPDRAHISTSHIERQNLSMRMAMRRFTRLTNAFSKKVENLKAAVALHFVHYNFCRIHQTIRVTPAMEARVTDHVWEIAEIVGLLAS